MQADSCIALGHLHRIDGRPGQDYALAGVLPDEGAYAIVSDGCSTGGQTDVGARVVAMATAGAIQEHWTTTHNPLHPLAAGQIVTHQHKTIARTLESLGCPTEDMLATSVFAYLSTKGGFVHFQGDGVGAWQFLDGTIIMVRLSWAGEMPFYPMYAVTDKAAGFIRAHGGNLGAPLLSGEWWQWSPNGNFQRLPDMTFTLGQGVSGIWFPLTGPGLQAVAVFTDGVGQVDGMDWKDAVTQLLTFKNTTGEFFKRRLIRVVRDAHKVGHGPVDDLAGAVILM